MFLYWFSLLLSSSFREIQKSKMAAIWQSRRNHHVVCRQQFSLRTSKKHFCTDNLSFKSHCHRFYTCEGLAQSWYCKVHSFCKVRKPALLIFFFTWDTPVIWNTVNHSQPEDERSTINWFVSFLYCNFEFQWFKATYIMYGMTLCFNKDNNMG